ncbi:hypothetical protein P7C70_g5628, partial [Phenoliferia sp. Uapishka_3]
MSTRAHQKVPTEVWIKILTDPNFSYGDLKRFTRVCKLFKTILELPDFDHMLFRGDAIPSATLDRHTQISLHPVLKSGRCFIAGGYEDFYVPSRASDAGWRIKDLVCASDFATSPPVSMIDLMVAGAHLDSLALQDTDGIKVKQVLEGTAKATKSVLYFGEDPVSPEGSPCDYFDHGDWTGDWTGWKEAIIMEGGKVGLSTEGYAFGPKRVSSCDYNPGAALDTRFNFQH